jgi:G:T/U-mismatch repair DNA glycosylase
MSAVEWKKNCNCAGMNRLHIEQHPFPAFVPPNMCCLILGSFPGKEQSRGGLDENAWFYGAPLNQFWRILAKAYGRELKTKRDKKQLFEEAGIGITDIFKAVIRTSGSNLDENLQIEEYNWEVIEGILKTYKPKVLCTSRFVEKEFRKKFPAYLAVDVLPSPSPRYFKLTIEQKAEVYREKLPQLRNQA